MCIPIRTYSVATKPVNPWRYQSNARSPTSLPLRAGTLLQVFRKGGQVVWAWAQENGSDNRASPSNAQILVSPVICNRFNLLGASHTCVGVSCFDNLRGGCIQPYVSFLMATPSRDGLPILPIRQYQASILPQRILFYEKD